ncbi:MAG: 5'-nucleotidase SurE [Gemmatales bacterium]|nr:MAG: 5'-nucleotidase SurE [Gemmatales bacterium]
MKFLLTNDDGIAAPGLLALEQLARDLGKAIVVAPKDHESGCSHRVTTASPFRVLEVGPGRFAVEGTPADCVRIALHDLIDGEPYCVLSGINAGGNLGADIHHSGTVAAVREAVLHGLPGIALSYYQRDRRPFHWQRAIALAKPIVQQLVSCSWTPGVFYNINIPNLDELPADPDVVFCPVDPSPLPINFHRDGDVWHYNANYHSRQRTPGCDVDVCFSGKISVSRIEVTSPAPSGPSFPEK